MKKLLLTFITFCFIHFATGQVTNTFNDFEDGTTQGWINGGNSPNPPVNFPDGGPNGAGDNYLEEVSTGGSGAGSKLVIFNTNEEWNGDFSIASDIAMDIRNPSGQNYLLRIAFQGGDDNTQIVLTDPVTIPGQSDWSSYTFSLNPSEFSVVNNGDNTPEEVLADVKEIRILHNPNVSYNGASIVAILHLDNISVQEVLGVEDLFSNQITIYPLPVVNELFILSNTPVELFRVFDNLGRLVLEGTNTSAAINLDKLSAGSYMIQLVSEEGFVTTKKFIKR